LVVDNRGPTLDRSVRLKGRDPERAVRIRFHSERVDVRRGQAVATRIQLKAAPPPPGEEVARPFSVVAVYGADEVEASGTFVLITSPPPIKKAVMRIEPEIVRSRGGHGKYRVSVENRDDSQWLQIGMAVSDPERIVRSRLGQDQFSVAPRQMAATLLDVWAPRPKRGQTVSREFDVSASDGRETFGARGTFTQYTGNWIPFVRILLTLLGGTLAIVGACTAWMNQNFYLDKLTERDYYTQEMPKIMRIGFLVQDTQPGVRALIIFFAALMIIGIFGRGGKLTMAAAVFIVIAMVAYFIYLGVQNWSDGGPGGPAAGAVVVIVGAVVGFLAGLLGFVTRPS
jgi:hypothetical protein